MFISSLFLFILMEIKGKIAKGEDMKIIKERIGIQEGGSEILTNVNDGASRTLEI